MPITSNTKQIDLWQIVVKKLVKGKDGKILLDQIRSFDKQRLLRRIGKLTEKDMKKIRLTLKEMLLLD